MLLIVSNKNDIHVDVLVERLIKRKILFFRWNIEDLSDQFLSILTINNNVDINLLTKDDKFFLQDIKVVWYRRPGEIEIHPDIKELDYRHFAQREWLSMLRGLWFLLEDKFWITNPFSDQRIGNKVFQLHLARKCGLKMPPTLITNNPVEVEKFFRIYEWVAIKCCSVGYVNKSKLIYTNKICFEDIKDKLNLIKYSPIIFQQYIEKKLEFRITVIDEDFFACAIDSQKSERTKVDWRRYDFQNVPHYPFDLPEDIKLKLLNFMKESRLIFATFDMALTSDGEYMFFECNPNGQWYWIEILTGLKIADKLADLIQKLMI